MRPNGADSNSLTDNVAASTPNELQLLIFTVAQHQYALPLNSVERVLPMVELLPLPGAPSVILGIFDYQGRVIPVIDLRRRLNLAPCEYGVNSCLLLARTVRRPLALPIDGVPDLREVPYSSITSPGSVLPEIAHLSGIARLDDGMVLIQDLDAFLSLEEQYRLRSALREEAP